MTIQYIKYGNGKKEKLAEFREIYRSETSDDGIGYSIFEYYDKNDNLINKEEYEQLIADTSKDLTDMNIQYNVLAADDYVIQRENKKEKDIVRAAYEAYKVGENSDNSQGNTETMSVEKASALMSNFIHSGQYKNCIDEFYLNYNLEYVIQDINADGLPELIMQSDFDKPFYITWLFALDGENVVLVNENYGYGMYRYSPKYKALLISPETRPFLGTGAAPFYILEGTEFKELFVVGEDVGEAFYSDASGTKSITQEERSAYFNDVVNFEFKKLN